MDRLWQRGIKKEALALDGWLKDVAPSSELRLWFGQDVARLVEFRRRYLAELKSNATALNPVREALQHGSVTLVYAAQDEAHNQAGVLRELLSTSSPRSNPFGPESRRTQTSSRC